VPSGSPPGEIVENGRCLCRCHGRCRTKSNFRFVDEEFIGCARAALIHRALLPSVESAHLGFFACSAAADGLELSRDGPKWFLGSPVDAVQLNVEAFYLITTAASGL